MTPWRCWFAVISFLVFASHSFAASTAALTPEQKAWVAKGKRFERSGWIYLHTQGEARERGFQHGFLLAKEIGEALRVTKVEWEYGSTMDWNWLVKRACAMFVPKIDAEDMAELEGITEGARAAGEEVSRDDLITYNSIIELTDYWWPIEMKRMKDSPVAISRESCSSFVATGKWTKDGNIVLGHNTMQDYGEVFPNVIEDIEPAHGHRILWQTTPGWIHSGTDFFITDAGLVGSETTIGQFDGFDTNGIPEFIRMRRATQDSATIDEWSDTMRRGNNGGYANAWLLGDINTREIARLELGLKYVGYEKKKDGYFVGSNVAMDRRILLFETDRPATDIRISSVARNVRWKELMKENKGSIDLSLAKKFEADHYDSWKEKIIPGGRSLCGHFELDAMGQGHDVPFDCSGTVDGKVVDAKLAKGMSFQARWGAACGMAFDAEKFLAAHPQFDDMKGILKDRPSEPWVTFRAGE